MVSQSLSLCFPRSHLLPFVSPIFQAPTDKLLGSLMMLVAAVVFTYYTSWALLMVSLHLPMLSNGRLVSSELLARLGGLVLAPFQPSKPELTIYLPPSRPPSLPSPIPITTLPRPFPASPLPHRHDLRPSVAQPFLPPTHAFQSFFPPREWAVRLPVLVLLLGVASVGGFVGLVTYKEGVKRRAREMKRA